jgi:hypothetical protein
MKTYSFRDSLRPLLLTGMQALRSPVFTPSLNDAPLAISLGAAKYGVRLRPSGDDDGAMAPDYIRWVERILTPGSDAFVVEEAGHFLQLEQPEVVGRHIVDFIGRV